MTLSIETICMEENPRITSDINLMNYQFLLMIFSKNYLTTQKKEEKKIIDLLMVQLQSFVH